MLRIALAAALVATAATPALASRLAHSPAQVSAALKEGCTVQQVHTPAGKIVHSPAIVRCDQRAVAVAKPAPTPSTQVALAN